MLRRWHLRAYSLGLGRFDAARFTGSDYALRCGARRDREESDKRCMSTDLTNEAPN